MADTGENRQIVERTNAREAETLRTSRKMVSEERSAEKANGAEFGDRKGFRERAKVSKRQSSRPKASRS
jgi:hypothetical protein